MFVEEKTEDVESTFHGSVGKFILSPSFPPSMWDLYVSDSRSASQSFMDCLSKQGNMHIQMIGRTVDRVIFFCSFCISGETRNRSRSWRSQGVWPGDTCLVSVIKALI